MLIPTVMNLLVYENEISGHTAGTKFLVETEVLN